MRFRCLHCKGIVALDDCEGGEAVTCGHCARVVAVPLSISSPGAVLGDFVIEKELGSGGMGTVFLAEQLSLVRPAALKILHSQFSQDPGYVESFVREARAAAALNHPNIVQAYAVGEEEGIFYFAMEYIEGSTLKQVLMHGGRMVLERALFVAEQMAEAIRFAWSRKRLVHGDIKPDNIILTSDGGAKLADLGLARIAEDMLKDGESSLYGTPQYIAPEQLLGQQGDHSSDIYSLGATLYHAVTGKYPYTGKKTIDIARKHLGKPLVPPNDVVPEVSPEMSRMIEIMLAKKSEHRYEDARELLEDIKGVKKGEMPKRKLPENAQNPITITKNKKIKQKIIDKIPDNNGTQKTAENKKENEQKGKKKSAEKQGSKKKLLINKNKGSDGKTILKIRKKTGKTVFTPAADEAEKDETPKKDKRSIPAFVLPGVLLLLAALVGALVLKHKLGKPQEETDTATVEPSAPHTDSLEKLDRMIRSGADKTNILEYTRSLVKECSPGSRIQSQILETAAPVIEEEILALRQTSHRTELDGWQKRADTLQEKAELARAEQERKEREAERLRQEKAETERKALERTEYVDKLRQKQDRLRWEAIDLCRKDDHDSAELNFVPMSELKHPRYPEIAENARQWALEKQKCIHYAEEAFSLVCNSREKLAGIPFPLPGKREKAVIEYIGRTHVEMVVGRAELKDGTEAATPPRRIRLPLADLSAQAIGYLCRVSWEKEERENASLDLRFGAYLLAKGVFPKEIRKRLEKCGMPDETAPMIKELSIIEDDIRVEWYSRIMDLRNIVASGNHDKAKNLAEYLKRKYPKQHQSYKDEINHMLQYR